MVEGFQASSTADVAFIMTYYIKRSTSYLSLHVCVWRDGPHHQTHVNSSTVVTPFINQTIGEATRLLCMIGHSLEQAPSELYYDFRG
jgi:hypothetical protein